MIVAGGEKDIYSSIPQAYIPGSFHTRVKMSLVPSDSAVSRYDSYMYISFIELVLTLSYSSTFYCNRVKKGRALGGGGYLVQL